MSSFSLKIAHFPLSHCLDNFGKKYTSNAGDGRGERDIRYLLELKQRWLSVTSVVLAAAMCVVNLNRYVGKWSFEWF